MVNEKTEPLFKVVVVVDNHTHEGKKIKKDTSIHVTAAQKAWMMKNQLIKGEA